jgi:dipeptidyl aminopeptidase/acylaminoacyl peptidase
VLVRRLLLIAALVPLAVSSTTQATAAGANGRIVFTREVDFASNVFSISPDGTAERRLTWTFLEDEASPDVSPDGSRVVFDRQDMGGWSHIWVMNADGSAQTQLTPFSPNSGEYDPRWSPDGSAIVFTASGSVGTSLWLMNADGTGRHRIVGGSGSGAAWSPDGRQLAYDNNSQGISVIGVDGSDPHMVTGPYSYGPSWSPDGTKLVYARNDSHLYTVNLDGSDEQPLTGGAFADGSPTWSPDGTQVAFRRVASGTFRSDLWVIGADGSDPHQVTTGVNGFGRIGWGSSQAVPEPNPPEDPQIVIGSPHDHGGYLPGPIQVEYLCRSVVSYVVSCNGDAPNHGEFTALAAGTQTFSVHATDANGRTSTASVSYEVPDVTPPTITVRAPAQGAVYEQGSHVVVDYGCEDPNGDGNFVCVSTTPNGAALDTSQVGLHTFTASSFDDAGHYASVSVTYRVAGPPALTITSPIDGRYYALNADVRVGYSCIDQGGSGISSCTGDVPNGGSLDTSRAGSHTFTVSGVDNDGRSTSKTVKYTVVGPPLISITSPAPGSTFVLGTNVSPAYDCASTVPELHALTCSGPTAVDTTTVGLRTYTVTATDALGVTASGISKYTVVYPFAGFDSPVSANGSVDAKAGESIPLKFSLGGDRGLSVVSAVRWQPSSCGGTATGGPTAGAGSLSYSAASNRYVDLVGTDKAWKGTCRLLTLELADTTTHPVIVHFTN